MSADDGTGQRYVLVPFNKQEAISVHLAAERAAVSPWRRTTWASAATPA